MNAIFSHLVRSYKVYCFPTAHLVRYFLYKSAEMLSGTSSVCVDIGAGTAPYRQMLRTYFGIKTYLAVDIAPCDTTNVVADARRLPFMNGSIDLVVSFDVVQHIPQVSGVFDEMWRILKPGGRMLISFPFMYSECDFRDYYRWTMDGMRTELSCRGFEILREAKRGGILYVTACLLLWQVQHLLPGGRSGWRMKRKPLMLLRYAVVALLTLPFVPLTWIALGLDRLLPSSDCYMGGIILAARNSEYQP